MILIVLAFLVSGFMFADGPAADAGEDDHGKTEEHGEEKADGHAKKSHKKHSSRLSDENIPLDPDNVPDRPKPLIEWGEPFKGTGTLSPGFELPTGAVWQPSLLVFGTLRTGIQSNDLNDARVSEAVARLDLFSNLQLSGSERLVLGFRNLDQDGRFTSYIIDSEVPGLEEGGQEEFNAEIGSLFFEGDFGEIFPNLSPRDFKATDIGFAIGRQPLFFQEGMLINDSVDGIGLTRNTLQPGNSSNLRLTFFYGWDNVNRNNGIADSGRLYALLSSADFRRSTMDVDVAYVEGGNGFADLFAGGISAVQRIGLINTSFRVLASSASGGLAPDSDGLLLFSEVSWTPHYSHDLIYITSFWAMDEFTPVASGPSNGGPLGRAGINFAAVGLGNYGSPLSGQANDVAGGAIGTQMFFDHTRKQLLIEFAGRVGTASNITNQYGGTLRYQMAVGRRLVFQCDAFVNYREELDETFFGGRAELQVRF